MLGHLLVAEGIEGAAEYPSEGEEKRAPMRLANPGGSVPASAHTSDVIVIAAHSRLDYHRQA
jgi:hypothetical protein